MTELSKMVGIPFLAGGRGNGPVDCWGLVQRVFREVHQVELPDYPGISPEDIRRISQAFSQEVASWVNLEQPEPWCAVTISAGNLVHHVGIWTPCGKVLHSVPRQGSVCQSVHSLHSNGLRVTGYYKFNAATSHGPNNTD